MVSDRPSQDGKLPPGGPDDPVPFGRYYLLGMIARGGMAEVYRAKLQVGACRLLASKVMRPQLAREARFVDMFHREGKLAMLLQNRCIVETIALGQHDGRHFITMEYIGGRGLTQVLRRCQETQQRIPVPHAVYIAARIAEGLHFAHTLVGPDGRLHTTFEQVTAATGRLSSINPNLQNIPIRTETGREIRACFVAEPGNVLLSVDYSQVELRVLAHVADETVLKDVFHAKEDVHAATAAEVFEIGRDEVDVGWPLFLAVLRARERAAQLRIVVENGEQSCEAHDVLVIAFRPSSCAAP